MLRTPNSGICPATPDLARSIAVIRYDAERDFDFSTDQYTTPESYETHIANYTDSVIDELESAENDPEGRRIFVAKSAGIVVGYTNVTPYGMEASLPVSRIYELAVQPRLSRRGFGSSLLGYIQYSAGVNASIKAVKPSEGTALAMFYKAHGFTDVTSTGTTHDIVLAPQPAPDFVDTAFLLGCIRGDKTIEPHMRYSLMRDLCNQDKEKPITPRNASILRTYLFGKRINY
jgi:ribosomal protein S18 acetylase RimI-like enzyme